MPDIRDEAIRCRVVADIGGTTIWRWPSDDVVRPCAHRSPVFPRDPDFPAKADRVLDLYQRTHDRRALCNEKTFVQARCRCHPHPAAARAMRVEHEYDRRAWLAAWDVHHARVLARCEARRRHRPVRPPRPNEQTAKPLEWKLTRSDLDQLLKRLAGNPTSSRRLAQTRDRASDPELLVPRGINTLAFERPCIHARRVAPRFHICRPSGYARSARLASAAQDRSRCVTVTQRPAEYLASAYRRYARRPRASRAGSFSSDH
ncbi:MAG: hypothetical protein ACRDYX_06165 [Egibacteraceae bacterium]